MIVCLLWLKGRLFVSRRAARLGRALDWNCSPLFGHSVHRAHCVQEIEIEPGVHSRPGTSKRDVVVAASVQKRRPLGYLKRPTTDADGNAYRTHHLGWKSLRDQDSWPRYVRLNLWRERERERVWPRLHSKRLLPTETNQSLPARYCSFYRQVVSCIYIDVLALNGYFQLRCIVV